MTYWAMTFFSDAQVSKQRREEGGVIESGGLGQTEPGEGEGALRKIAPGSQCRYGGQDMVAVKEEGSEFRFRRGQGHTE